MMTDMTENEGAGTPAQPKTKFIVGGAILLSAIAGYGFAQVGGAPDWSARAAETDVEADEKAAAIAEAEAKKAEAEEKAKEQMVRGIIQPKTQSTIASKITARITSMPLQVGQSFRRGALLAAFDCSSTTAQLNAAQAAAAAYKLEYETNQELDAYEAIGTNEVAISKANLGRANAEARAIRAELSDCSLYSTFSGTVVEKLANRGEIAASGQTLMKIQSGGDLEVELIVPSDWLTWLKPGAPFKFLIDETGNTVSGTISRLGASVDPVSKTIRVTGTIEQQEGLVLPGMSGSAQIDKPTEKPDETQPSEEVAQEEPAEITTEGEGG